MKSKKMPRNYYKEIDDALKSYEEYKSYHTFDMDYICDRIDWCWKFRHITEKQMEELSNRACKILDRK